MSNIWNLFWIFIVIVSLLPMIQKRMMENRRLALMRKLEVKRLGLPVSAALTDEVYQLMDLFPQAGAQRPSVQYIPVPYKKAAGKPEEK